MRAVFAMATAFWRSERGATSIEYAIIGSVISISIVVGAKAIGLNLTPYFSKVANNLT